MAKGLRHADAYVRFEAVVKLRVAADRGKLTPEGLAEVKPLLLETLKEAIGTAAQLTVLAAPVTLDRLEAELRNGYHLLHFVGHGAFLLSFRFASPRAHRRLKKICTRWRKNGRRRSESIKNERISDE